MSGSTARHPSIAHAQRTHILTCGCDSYAPGHHVHWIQTRLFSQCPPEKIVDTRLEGWEGNHLTLTVGDERRVGWHADPGAVATFCAVAEQAAPGHPAFFGQSSLMATSNGQVSALIYLDFTGEERPCVWRDGESRPRPSRRTTGPALIWIDQPPEG